MEYLGFKLISTTKHGVHNIDTLYDEDYGEDSYAAHFIMDFCTIINQQNNNFSNYYNIFVRDEGRGFYVVQHGKLVYETDFDIIDNIECKPDDEIEEILYELVDTFNNYVLESKLKMINNVIVYDEDKLKKVNRDILDHYVYNRFDCVYG